MCIRDRSGDAALSGRGHGEGQTAEVFARLLELSDERALQALAVVAGEALVAGGGLAERLGELLEIDMRACWQPDDTFFDLLTDLSLIHIQMCIRERNRSTSTKRSPG